MKKWLLHSDGASLKNPGPGGAGAVLYDEAGNIAAEISIYLGEVTNNEAEYQGLLWGLSKAIELKVEHLVVKMDSELIVRQLNGIYKVKNARLKIFYDQALKLLSNLKSHEIIHVRREFNAEADHLASKAAKSGSSGLLKPKIWGENTISES